MTAVLLIQPMTNEKDMVYAPLGLIALGAALEDQFDVKILDQRLEKDFNQTLIGELKKKPLVVGITSITGQQIFHGIKISKLIRDYSPETPIVWGGVHPSFVTESTLTHDAVDFVILNEGEAALLELVRALENKRKDFEKIESLCYKRNGEFFMNPRRAPLDMTKLPEPAWHLISVPQYVSRLSEGPKDSKIDITTSRGCPYRCEFCYEIAWSNRTWRGRTAEQVISEIRMLSDRYGVNHIIFHDDLFIVNKKTKERALEIAKGINSDGYKVKWTMTYRVDQLCNDVPYAERLVENGFYEMRAGVESGSQRILDLMKKDLRVEHTLESARITRQLGIHVFYSFVLGWPGETDEDRKKTIDLCFRLLDINPDSKIYPLNIYTPYPGSPQWDRAVEEGFVPPESLEEWGEYVWGNVNIPWITDETKFENMSALSKIAFFNRSSREVFSGLFSPDLKTSTKFRRLVGWFVRPYASFRIRSLPGFLPYEYKLIGSLL